MTSTLISIDDWIDRFGLELIDSEPLVHEALTGFTLVMSCSDSGDGERAGPAPAASNVRRSSNLVRHADGHSSVHRGSRAGNPGPSAAFAPNAVHRAPALLQ